MEFKSGGISGSHPDTFEKSLGKVPLAAEWSSFTLHLENEDLSNVVGAFAWIATASDNDGPTVVYIARLTIE